ncbi:MAG TPA: 6,7-dimethyl-8-ribityllumazine synthase [Bacteroidia bacterium]|nr:6,7-dimethyl-8-ribityllumazine synthase [Bacteroidia bacterium]
MKNLSDTGTSNVPSGSGKRIAVIIAEWNSEITFAMRDAAVSTLQKHGCDDTNVVVHYVPGTFELTLGSLWAAMHADTDAVIAIGCVVRGETPHFDYICKAVSYGITELNVNLRKPVIFAVLTTENLEQAKERAGGKYGNKGEEAAITALKMLALRSSMMK